MTANVTRLIRDGQGWRTLIDRRPVPHRDDFVGELAQVVKLLRRNRSVEAQERLTRILDREYPTWRNLA